MNAQAKYRSDGVLIGRGIEWTAIFGEGTGYTANPIRGCTHGCRWRMSDGKIVDCYAESQRDRLDGKGAFKNITFHADVLQKIERHTSPAGIFIDSMTDLMGDGVQTIWIDQVIETIRRCQQHRFFVLTKNPRRLTEFNWPNNVLVGISAPPTFMYGKELNVAQQRTWFWKGAEWLSATEAFLKWYSLEPLTIDLSDIIHDHPVDWAVIGAGSDGSKKYQPGELVFQKTLNALKFDETLNFSETKLFFKGNLDRAMAERHGGWHEEFPKI